MTVNPDGGGGRSARGGKRRLHSRTPVVAPAAYYGAVPYRWANGVRSIPPGYKARHTG